MKINFVYFLVSFAVGIFWVYVMTPPPELVVKFPSPYNAGLVMYKDKAENCYKYNAEKINCEGVKWSPQPIVEDFQSKCL